MSGTVRCQVPPQLNQRQRRTYEAVYRHLPAHELAWHDVRSLLEHLADVTEIDDDSFRATRAGQEVVFHTPQGRDGVSPEDLLTVRRFLNQTSESNGVGADTCMLVVIDHHEAKVYRTVEHGAVPDRIAPDEPTGHRGRVRSRRQETDGKRVPVRRRYLDAVATALRGADRILLFGSGSGESSAMDQLMTNLTDHHHDVAERVIGCVVIDAHHRTEGQLLAKAREYFAPDVG